ncbi:MAG: type IV toxin-antitoxin system AbiEi family antitoxin domain-containing protein [Acidimicrobiia bacterium]
MATLSRLSQSTLGVFRTADAAAQGVSAKQVAGLAARGVIERVHPRTYRLIAVAPSSQQRLVAALLWAGPHAAAAGRSAGEQYRLEDVRADVPEIVVPHDVRGRSAAVIDGHAPRAPSMVRSVHGVRTTGVEATLVRLAHVLDAEAFEVACEDARRRRLTSIPALGAYLDRFGARGRPGVKTTRQLLAALDPQHPAYSTLEVKTRRLLVEHGITDFVRELPLEWNARRYRFDFAFPRQRVILETNGRRWHDDAADFDRDNEKWSVPGRHGYRLVMATWHKVTRQPRELIDELSATLALR